MAAATTTQDVGEDQPVIQLKPKDFKGPIDPDWCAGCGDFGVLSCVQKACAELGLRARSRLSIALIEACRARSSVSKCCSKSSWASSSEASRDFSLSSCCASSSLQRLTRSSASCVMAANRFSIESACSRASRDFPTSSSATTCNSRRVCCAISW